MSYRVIIPKPVQKQLRELPPKVRSRLLAEIKLLADNPRPDGVKKLKGYEDMYRIRVGSYRVIYEVEDGKMLVLVVSAVHRQSAY
ncbi:mRNA interferase RelE [Microcystis aeruginosa NIES-4325]|uniref:mRNA interferase RelE n=1 Tax=Microcystis aeruginosa NIES-4325 TaxID=2569534 RepID=A0A5J4F7P4_MICAE|nr:type II toxin-antitoxin system RelE/ParE family toxin [Microcystis aeruginosa]GEA26525.1 mRNA interferase RelE [Microcystis aeruginosa NIES-4325]